MKRIILPILIVISLLFLSCSVTKTVSKKEQKVLIETTAGNIVVKLYNETPLHRDNFIKLVKSKFYDGLLFHRVIADFMIQGGDPDSKKAQSNAMLGNGDVGYTIPAEFRTPEIFHKKGVLAAAREGDDVNPEKASSGCQFYIVVGKVFTDKDLNALQTKKQKQDSTFVYTEKQRETYKTIGGTPHLDGNYTVFGEVVKGMDVVEKISKVKTNSADRPIEDVRIIKMKLIK